MKEKGLIEVISTLIGFSIFIIGISWYFLLNKMLIGPIFFVMGLCVLGYLKFSKVKFNDFYPDMIFGFVDNFVMVFATTLGGSLAGVGGAIIGGVTGNTLTDGLGGLFEGYIVEHQHKFKIDNVRTAFSTMLGKIAGCLFGAGIGLTLMWLISLI